MTENPYYTTLSNRGLIHIGGDDAREFLQGLISNDMEILKKTGDVIYACLLTPQGKFLHDFFVTQGDGRFTLECEGGERAKDLYARLTKYRLRSNVEISLKENIEIYAVFGTEAQNAYIDSRHINMGLRCLEKPIGIEERSFNEWDKRRIALCIPDGSRDMILESSTLLECGIDRLKGVSFDKGCYVGQEITARMHYRGLLKKRLYAIKGDNLPAHGEPIIINEVNMGEMRSSCGSIGLALLKDSEINALPEHDISLLLSLRDEGEVIS